jgi:hypothetical protein
VPTVLTLKAPAWVDTSAAATAAKLASNRMLATSAQPCNCHNGDRQPCRLCRRGAQLPPPDSSASLAWVEGLRAPVSQLNVGANSASAPAGISSGARTGAAGQPLHVVTMPDIAVDWDAILATTQGYVACADCADALYDAMRRRVRGGTPCQVSANAHNHRPPPPPRPPPPRFPRHPWCGGAGRGRGMAGRQ